MKALPAQGPPKFGTFSAGRPHSGPASSPAMSIKRAIPVEKGKKKNNGE
jgi:hypothetical protein